MREWKEGNLLFKFKTKAFKFDDETKNFYSKISSFLSSCDFVYWTEEKIYFLEVKREDFFSSPSQESITEKVEEKASEKLEKCLEKLKIIEQNQTINTNEIKNYLNSIHQLLTSLKDRIDSILKEYGIQPSDKNIKDENVKTLAKNLVDTVGALILSREEEFDLLDEKHVIPVLITLIAKREIIINIVVDTEKEDKEAKEENASLTEVIERQLEKTISVFDVEVIVESPQDHDKTLKEIYKLTQEGK